MEEFWKKLDDWWGMWKGIKERVEGNTKVYSRKQGKGINFVGQEFGKEENITNMPTIIEARHMECLKDRREGNECSVWKPPSWGIFSEPAQSINILFINPWNIIVYAVS